MNSEPSDENPIDLSARSFVVTGANSGIGFETVRALSRSGGRVILACRSEQKAKHAIDRILGEQPAARLEFVALDLASLASIEDCARQLHDRLDHLDVLCHNAGVMGLPRSLTLDGFEMQMGVNHFGHFALAGRLLDLLLQAPQPRVVQVCSRSHVLGRVNLDDLHSERRYGKWRAYANSKLANQLYLHELQRLLERRASRLEAMGAHPGYAATDLLMLRNDDTKLTLRERVVKFGNRLIAQTASEGAAPTVHAATAPDARNGDYYGPGGLWQIWGPPKRVSPARRALDEDTAAGLWKKSVEFTGVDYAAIDA